MIRWLRHNYGTFDVGREIGPARWPHHDLFFVHDGAVRLTFPELQRDVLLRQGQGVLIWPHTAFHGHAVEGRARASIQHFEVARGVGEGLVRGAGKKNGFSVQGAPGSAELARDIERSVALARCEPPADPALRQALLNLILVEGGFGARATDASVARRLSLDELLSWLRTNIAQNPGVPELAKVAGLSASRFRALFLAEQGKTVGEFILRFREDEARRQLVETQRSLKEIARGLGYADAVVFHRAFKARVGQTPGGFRRKNRVNG